MPTITSNFTMPVPFNCHYYNVCLLPLLYALLINLSYALLIVCFASTCTTITSTTTTTAAAIVAAAAATTTTTILLIMIIIIVIFFIFAFLQVWTLLTTH